MTRNARKDNGNERVGRMQQTGGGGGDWRHKVHPGDISLKPFKPLNAKQTAALESIRVNDCTFLIGPAGTAKTFLAARYALEGLASGEFDHILIARPAVEAGDSIGYLPGKLLDKMMPFVRPVIDNLGKSSHESRQLIKGLLELEFIEVMSFTYLRGNSFDRTLMILDEIQNATPEQLKLGLTRAGEGSKIVVTGDPYQIDLDPDIPSAVEDLDRFRNQPGIGFLEFGMAEVVRSRMTKTILNAYGGK